MEHTKYGTESRIFSRKALNSRKYRARHRQISLWKYTSNESSEDEWLEEFSSPVNTSHAPSPKYLSDNRDQFKL